MCSDMHLATGFVVDEIDDIPTQAPAELSDIIINPFQTLPIRQQAEAQASQPDNVVHEGIFCDGRLCTVEKVSIAGRRYKCAECVDVDLCQRCVRDALNGHDLNHKLLECLQPALFVEPDKMQDEERAAFDRWAAQNESRVQHLQVSTDEYRQPSATSRELSKNSPITGLPGVDVCRVGDDGELVLENIPLAPQDFLAGATSREAVTQHNDPADILRLIHGQLRLYRYPRDQFYHDLWAGIPATRVLDLLPGAYDEKLCATLRCIRLDENVPQYDALSYTWKETAFERAFNNLQSDDTDKAMKHKYEVRYTVYIGDENFLEINTGLRDALRRVRSTKHVYTIWCDQICIDQRNVSEKNLQVKLMELIYNRARRVIVWSGESDKDTDAATELIEKIGTRCACPDDELPDPGQLEAEHALDIPPLSATAWVSLFKFFTRPVFSRGWVIQEIALARELVIRLGEQTIDWTKLVNTLRMLHRPRWVTATLKMYRKVFEDFTPLVRGQTLQDWSGARPDFLLEIHNIRQDLRHQRMTLSALLERAYTFQTTNPYDKVYALLGLGPRWAKEVITVNYDSDLSAVYKQTTRALLEREHTLSPLSRAGLSYQRQQDLPSWVSDWSIFFPHCQYSSETLGIPYRASKDSRVDVQWPFVEDDSILQTKSYKVATVSQVGQKVLEKRTYSDHTIAPHELVSEAAHVLAMRTSSPPGETDTLDAFLCIWIGDYTGMQPTIPAPKGLLAALNTHLIDQMLAANDEDVAAVAGDNFCLLNMLLLYVETEESPKREQHAEPPGYAAFMANRRFFITTEGYFGLGPTSVTSGDEVHILSGGKTPYIMRPLRAPDGHALVGDAYVQGIMAGEALEAPGFAWHDFFIQ